MSGSTGYWSTHDSETLPEEAADHIVSGTEIRFIWDYGVTVPLWDAEGLLPDDSAWLQEALGLSDELVMALTAWGSEMCRVDDQPWERELSPQQWEIAYGALNDRAKDLVVRLRRELTSPFAVRYKPW